MFMVVVILLCIMLLFLGLGILFLNGKGAFLIAGYNTKSKAEQEKYDKIALCKFMGKMNLTLAFCMVFLIISRVYQIPFLLFMGVVLFFIIIAFMLFYLNTKNRFKQVQ